MANDKTKNLYQKLLVIQQHINGLGKDKSGGQFRYVTGDKVLEHIKPIMNEQGLILKQEVLSIDNTRQDYKTSGGEKSEINSKVMLRFTWVDTATGDKDENLFGANGQNGWDKGVGSALTYGERYFLLKYFHIATDEDDIDNPERVPAAVEVKTIDLAVNEMLKSTDRKEMEAAWKKYPTMQKEPRFMEAVKQMGAKFPKETPVPTPEPEKMLPAFASEDDKNILRKMANEVGYDRQVLKNVLLRIDKLKTIEETESMKDELQGILDQALAG